MVHFTYRAKLEKKKWKLLRCMPKGKNLGPTSLYELRRGKLGGFLFGLTAEINSSYFQNRAPNYIFF